MPYRQNFHLVCPLLVLILLILHNTYKTVCNKEKLEPTYLIFRYTGELLGRLGQRFVRPGGANLTGRNTTEYDDVMFMDVLKISSMYLQFRVGKGFRHFYD